MQNPCGSRMCVLTAAPHTAYGRIRVYCTDGLMLTVSVLFIVSLTHSRSHLVSL